MCSKSTTRESSIYPAICLSVSCTDILYRKSYFGFLKGVLSFFWGDGNYKLPRGNFKTFYKKKSVQYSKFGLRLPYVFLLSFIILTFLKILLKRLSKLTIKPELFTYSFKKMKVNFKS